MGHGVGCAGESVGRPDSGNARVKYPKRAPRRSRHTELLPSPPRSPRSSTHGAQRSPRSTARQEGPTLNRPTFAAWSAADRSPRGATCEYVVAEGETVLCDARLTLSMSASRLVSREGSSDLPFFGIRPIRHPFDDAPPGVRGHLGACSKGYLTCGFMVRVVARPVSLRAAGQGDGSALVPC